jgi:hypothetical protein
MKRQAVLASAHAMDDAALDHVFAARHRRAQTPMLMSSFGIIVGAGEFSRFGLALEASDGIELWVYDKEELQDFTLRLQWRAPTIRNNSGVYVRLPKNMLGDIGKLIKTAMKFKAISVSKSF